MALEMNTSQVADKSVLVENENGRQVWSRKTLTIASLMHHSGDTEISEKTIDALWARADFTQRTLRAVPMSIAFMGLGSARLTRDDLVAHMGMTTNTVPRKSDAAYLKWVWGIFCDSQQWLADRDADDLADLAALIEGAQPASV